MKLSKDTLIEGKVVKKGVEVQVVREGFSGDNSVKNIISDFVSEMLDDPFEIDESMLSFAMDGLSEKIVYGIIHSANDKGEDKHGRYMLKELLKAMNRLARNFK